MSNLGQHFPGNLQFRLTLLFLLMGAGLTALVSSYWFISLEPRLLLDAKASAGALAQSQSRNLANALAQALDKGDPTPLQDAMDEILVLTDPSTELPFVAKLEVNVDYNTVAAPAKSLNLQRGMPCNSCFVTQIPLYNPVGGELLGVATFHSSNAFFEQVRDAVRSRLLLVTIGAMALLLLSWRAVAGLFRAAQASARAAIYAKAQERGAAVERERIARDLHDDVAPQLLTLAHSAESVENAERARAAMQTLRESIYMLNDPRQLALDIVLAEWRIEVAERTEAAGISLAWQQPTTLPELPLTSRQRLNLGRVLREAISNALRHAAPSVFNIAVDINGPHLRMQLTHDGHITPPESWLAGKGLNNMRARIAELGGHIEWQWLPSPTQLTLTWDIPLDTAERVAHL